MGLIETLRKCIEGRNNLREQLLDGTDEKRRASILRKRMHVYPATSLAKRAATARTFDAGMATDNQCRSDEEEQTVVMFPAFSSLG